MTKSGLNSFWIQCGVNFSDGEERKYTMIIGVYPHLGFNVWSGWRDDGLSISTRLFLKIPLTISICYKLHLPTSTRLSVWVWDYYWDNSILFPKYNNYCEQEDQRQCMYIGLFSSPLSAKAVFVSSNGEKTFRKTPIANIPKFQRYGQFHNQKNVVLMKEVIRNCSTTLQEINFIQS